MLIDFHIHTTASDGQYSPSQLVNRAYSQGIMAMSFTDHDTINGITEGRTQAEKRGIQFIPGIEISCQDLEEIHILGYKIDISNTDLIDSCREYFSERKKRGERIKEYLSSLGLEVDLDIVYSYAGNGNLGRPHFAKYLVDMGIVKSTKEAFIKYLGTDEFMMATDRKKPSPEQAIELIHKAKGVAVLAHPGNYNKIGGDGIESLINRLAINGIDGIECFYSGHTEHQTRKYLELMRRFGLKTGCGSDFHGESIKPNITLGMEFDLSYRDYLIINDI